MRCVCAGVGIASEINDFNQDGCTVPSACNLVCECACNLCWTLKCMLFQNFDVCTYDNYSVTAVFALLLKCGDTLGRRSSIFSWIKCPISKP